MVVRMLLPGTDTSLLYDSKDDADVGLLQLACGQHVCVLHHSYGSIHPAVLYVGFCLLPIKMQQVWSFIATICNSIKI